MSKQNKIINRVFYNSFFYWFIGIAVALITVLVFQGNETSKLNLLAEHFFYEFDYKSLEYGMLFSTVLFTRLPILIVILISKQLLHGMKLCNGIGLLYGFTMGYVFFVLCLQYGFRGLILCILFWTPHMFLYLFIIYYLTKHERVQGSSVIVICCVYFIGMLGEIYINPAILNSLIKFL